MRSSSPSPCARNIPAAIFTTLCTNPLTFVPLYVLAYNVGRLVTGDSTPLVIPPETDWNWEGLKLLVPDLLSWIASLGDTLLIGLAIQCTMFAIAGYLFTMFAWRLMVTRAWRNRPASRARRSP